MGRRGALTNVEKSKIIQGFNMKRSTLEISKTIGTDHRTVKKFANKPESCNGRSDKGKLRKSTRVSHRALNLIKREVSRNPLQSSKEVFKDEGVSGIPKTSRCSILKRLAKCATRRNHLSGPKST